MIDMTRVEWLNYHHLLYFYLVVREGGVVPAAKVLRLSHSTISGQLRVLEETLGVALFDRSGRRLVPTENGHVVYRYANEIFGLGREMLHVLRGHAAERPALRVGASAALPKLVTVELIAPALALGLRVSVEEDHFDRLVARLATHELDVILTDAPLPAGSGVRAFNHLLGESEVGIFAAPKLARRLRRGFPRSLHEAPMVLPTAHATLRRLFEPWAERQGIEPQVVAESSDSALAKALASAGHGALLAPSRVAADLALHYDLELVGKACGIRERFYAVSMERRVRAPGVVAICAEARERLFAS